MRILIIIVTICLFSIQSASAMTSFGIAYPTGYSSGNYSSVINDLNINRSNLSIFWGKIELTNNNFSWTALDNYIAQLNTEASSIIRVSGRPQAGTEGTHWGTTSASSYTVPIEYSYPIYGINGDYYDYVNSVVNHVNGLSNGNRVTGYEMEWEADCTMGHWGGTYQEYAEMAHTFYMAVKDANPNAFVILGAANGDLGQLCSSFTTSVLSYLAINYPTQAFDKFDMHLYYHQRATGYYHWTSTDDRVIYYRDILTAYFSDKPIIVTEYGSPSPNEFDFIDTAAYTNLETAFNNDPCILATTMSSYPDHLRMFSTNLTGDIVILDQKVNRIVGKEYVYKNLLAASAGVNEMYYWNLVIPWSMSCPSAYMGSPLYGKMGLHLTIGGGPITQRDTYTYFKKFISKVGNTILSSLKIDIVGYPSVYLYDVVKTDGSKIKVIWENRNLFNGEDAAATPVTISVSPWNGVFVEDLFGNIQTPNVIGGNITLAIKDTPIFISEIIDTTPPAPPTGLQVQ